MTLSDLRIPSGYWYLATCYSLWPKGIHDAARVAAKLAGRLQKQGVPIFCPVAHTHLIALAADIEPLNHDFWMAADRPMMHAARGLIVATMDGWTKSRGITEEIAEFHKAGKPMYLVDPVTLDVEPLK